MVKKKEFEHDSLQDVASLVEYLKTVTRGFEDGAINVSGKDGEITLEPRGLIRFELRVSQRPDRNRLTLRFTWKPGRDDDTESKDELLITSGGDVPAPKTD